MRRRVRRHRGTHSARMTSPSSCWYASSRETSCEHCEFLDGCPRAAMMSGDVRSERANFVPVMSDAIWRVDRFPLHDASTNQYGALIVEIFRLRNARTDNREHRADWRHIRLGAKYRSERV